MNVEYVMYHVKVCNNFTPHHQRDKYSVQTLKFYIYIYMYYIGFPINDGYKFIKDQFLVTFLY